jgi:hypothetical protein
LEEFTLADAGGKFGRNLLPDRGSLGIVELSLSHDASSQVFDRSYDTDERGKGKERVSAPWLVGLVALIGLTGCGTILNITPWPPGCHA